MLHCTALHYNVGYCILLYCTRAQCTAWNCFYWFYIFHFYHCAELYFTFLCTEVSAFKRSRVPQVITTLEPPTD